MPRLMRCLYCGTRQDEPSGAKTCACCGGELVFEAEPDPSARGSYLQVQMELDQVQAPAGQNVERHLLVTLRAPAHVPSEHAAPTTSGRPALAFSAVLDVSGSMTGPKLLQAKDALRQALVRLQDGDSLALVTFESQVHSVVEPITVNDASRRVVQSALDEVQATGMTALCGGLEMGLEKAAAMARDSNLVLLLSDGQANVGETDLEKVGQHASGGRQRGVTVSTLGVGQDYNEALMAEIATQGGGRFYHVQRADQISAYLTGELGEVADVAHGDVHVQLTLPVGGVVMPLSVAYPAQQEAGRATITVGDIPCDTELEIPLRVTLPAQSVGTRVSFEGVVTYHSPAGNALQSVLNRVTVRIAEKAAFEPRSGVVVPVVERVLEHMRATTTLSYARATASSPALGQKEITSGLARLRAYASLLGEERAAKEARADEAGFFCLAAEPAAAKLGVAAAFARTRGTKKFGG